MNMYMYMCIHVCEKWFNDYNNGINRDLIGIHIFICMQIYMNIYTFKYV
jgi:hypothetical protein